jgi:hypothetical protein
MNEIDWMPAGQVVLDFVVAGKEEPYAFDPQGMLALQLALGISAAVGKIKENVEDVLLISYFVEGRGESPRMAEEIRRVIAATPVAMESLPTKDLKLEAKKIAKKRLAAPREAQPLSMAV